jgi:acetylornithine deacetylase
MSDGLVTTLRDLVAIDSTSSRSNLPVVEALERRLTAAGFRCERQRYADEAGVEKANLLAFLGSGLPEVALVAHTDCVPFDAGWSEALRLTERDGRLFGRGACDTKAFVASAVVAAERTRGRLERPVLLVFTADEELGCVGAKRLADAGLGRARRAIIGEPTSLRPIRANKGYCLAEVEVRGQEGHSAYPETGASAIFRAARLLERVERYAGGPLRAEEDPAFTPPFATLNVGFVSGGRAKNIIPGACRFTLEWRPLPAQDVEAVPRAVGEMIARCVEDEPGFSADLRPLRLDRGFDTPAEADVVRLLTRLSGNAPGTVAFGTEGPQLAALGAAPVVFGPGDITVAHRSGEHVPVSELVRAAEILEAALLELAGQERRLGSH